MEKITFLVKSEGVPGLDSLSTIAEHNCPTDDWAKHLFIDNP